MSEAGASERETLERRRVPRAPVPHVTQSLLGSESWTLELAPPQAMPRLSGAIEALADRALEGNVFLEPAILASAWPRLTTRLAPGGIVFACLWEGEGEGRRLRLFTPLLRERSPSLAGSLAGPFAGPFGGVRTVRTATNHFTPLGTPLLDRAEPEGNCATFLRLAADPALSLPPVLVLSHQMARGPVLAAFDAAADGLGLRRAAMRSHERGGLRARAHGTGGDRLRAVMGRKAYKELGRLRRRLAELGEVDVAMASEGHDVLDALEAFLTLELRSWKGRRGSALNSDRMVAAFSREIVARLAAQGRARILTITLDQRLVAGLVLLHRNGRAVAWKIAFDADLARFAPGVQAFCEASRALLADPDFHLADSLAVPNHAMVNRLWCDRLAIEDRVVALTSGDAELVDAHVRACRRRDLWHARARDAAMRLGLHARGHRHA